MSIPAAVREAIKQINSKHGPGTVIVLGESKALTVPRFSTGIAAFDEMTGGGLPLGSIIELFGEPSSGKSTLAQIFAAKIQRDGGTVAYFDLENGLDESWMKRFGINTEEVLWGEPETGEKVLDAVITLARADIDLIIIDSVAALAPREELEKVEEEGVGAKSMALLARLMSQSLRVLNNSLKKRKTIIIFINQFTTDIGAMATYYGVPVKTKGGLSLKQYARMRLEVIRTEWIKNEAAKKLAKIHQGRIGQKVLIRVAKSKVSPPFRSCEAVLMWYRKKDLEKMGIKTKSKKEKKDE